MLHVAKANPRTATALVASALLLSGCGSETAAPKAEAPPATTTIRGAAPTSPTVPDDRAIAAAQREPMAAPKDPKRALPALEVEAPKPGLASTAPTSVFDLGERAAAQWLVYRINGDAPDASVIPKRLWDSVPPAAPDLRMKGAAREGTKVVGAHPEDGGWIVSVATKDTRVSMIVVKIKRAAGRMKVTEVNG